MYRFLVTCLAVLAVFSNAAAQQEGNPAHDYRFSIMFHLSALQPIESDNMNAFSTASMTTATTLGVRYFHSIADDAQLGAGLKLPRLFTEIARDNGDLRLDDSWLEVLLSLHVNSSAGSGSIAGRQGFGVMYSALLGREKYLRPGSPPNTDITSSTDAFGYHKVGLFADYHLSFDVSSHLTPLLGITLSMDLLTFGESDDLQFPVKHRNVDIFFGFAF